MFHSGKPFTLFSGKTCRAAAILLLAIMPVLLSFGPVLATEKTARIILNDQTDNYILGKQMEFLEDPDKSLTIEEITSPAHAANFIPHDKDFPSFGFTESAYWFRTEIINPYPEKRDLILEEVLPYIDSIKVFLADPEHPGQHIIKEAGDKKPFYDREIEHHSFLFKLTFEPEQATTLFIRVESRAALMTPFTLWQSETFYTHSDNMAFAFGLFYGILAVMALYTFYIYLRMKDRNYLYFIFFISSIALMVSTSHGLSYQYLWPNSTYLAERMQVVCISAIQLFGVLFTRNFLNTRQSLPRIDKVLYMLFVLHLLVIVTTFLVDDVIPLAKVTILAVQFYSPLLFITGFLAWRQGNKAARFYLLAWTSSIIGSYITSFTLLNVLPYHFLLINAVSIGFLFDATFLSLALADRLYVLRQERDRAKQLAHDALLMAKDNLEEEVAKRTEELELAKKEADLANQAKTQFLSHMSHELRTPLNGILGFAELLLTDTETPLTEIQQRNVNIIHDSGKHLNALIDDILNISMIETGRMTVNQEPISFKDDLDRALVVTSTMAKKRKIQVHNATDENEHYWVMADSLRLRQIIINLISNAIKYSPEGSLVVVALEKKEEKIRFSVKDSGPGIAQEDLERIFEPFTRLDTKRDEVDGVGIGLAITRKLIEIMNGRVSVESIVGQGSTFIIEFDEIFPDPKPLAQAVETDKPERPDNATKIAETDPAKILYIEDNKANQVYVQHIFKRREDLNLVCVDSGREGIEKALEMVPDIILTDILLPDLSGHDVLKELRKNKTSEAIPVIAVSANATEADLSIGNQAGFIAYLTKPLGIGELLDTIDSVLHKRSSQGSGKESIP
ncbi:MAG: hypothetical protein C0623_14350 [Desulfuromonas sp.]|mgnify:CR=1 FL=1|nr:MAG: hypothetical protein C0623_14350 [Desulfuromonas sp.]